MQYSYSDESMVWECYVRWEKVTNEISAVYLHKHTHTPPPSFFDVHKNALKMYAPPPPHSLFFDLSLSLSLSFSPTLSQTQMKSWWLFSVLQKLGWPKFIKVILKM